MYLKTVALITGIAFTLIKKANFRLDPDNIGLFAVLASIAFMYHYLHKKQINSLFKTDFSNTIQSALYS